MVRPGEAWRGPVWQVGQGTARHSAVWRGKVWQER